MVTNIELPEHLHRVEAFVGITKELWDDPTLVDLLTEIIGIKQEFKIFWGEIDLYRADIDEYMAENLNFLEAATP
ncbi:hypothetical protein KY285_030216 [Solanum tuberosum]|nr:hypothetical protein KY285_030216 [Solanum tuberosum]